MRVTVTDAKGQLLDLVRRAEAGEEIILTRRGDPVARIVTVSATAEQRRAALIEARAAAFTASPGPSAARSQDFLYDEYGLPG